MRTFRIILELALICLLAAWSSTSVKPALMVALTNTPPATAISLPTVSVTSTPLPTVTATDPASVFMAYYAALTFKDLDAALALVADDASLCYERCYTTKEQVRAFWQREFDRGYTPYVSVLGVDGNAVRYAWTAVQNGRVDSWGTGEVIVEAGKVASDR